MKLKRIWRACFLATTFLLSLVLSIALPAISQTPVKVAQLTAVTNNFQQISEADQLFAAKKFEAAEKIYRQIKPPFNNEAGARVIMLSTPDQLPAGGQVFWRTAQEGITQNLESKIFISLRNLTESYPEFIPGHLELARACRANVKGCERSAQDDQPKDEIAVLERATSLYPDQPDFLDAKIAAFIANEKYLEASISARQFALTFPEDPKAPKYLKLADENLQAYRSYMQQKLQGLAIGNLFVSAITGDVSGAQVIGMLMEGESAFGEKLAAQQLEKFKGKLEEDPTILKYVNTLGQELAKRMGRDEFKYEFYVVRDPNLNAFALPGGKIFINTGALTAMQSKAELAGLLGHEIGHSVLSHGFQQVAETATLANIGKLIPLGDLITQVSTLENSRRNEQQADILGTRVIASAEYAADGLRNFLATLQQNSRGNAKPEWLSTHPTSSNRVRYLETLIQRSGLNRYAYEGVQEMAEIQAKLKGVPFDGGTAIATNNSGSQNSFAPNGTTVTPNPDGPDGPTVTPTPSPSPKVVVGKVDLVAALVKDRVQIQINGAEVSRTGSYTLNIVIKNDSDRPFGFVPLFAEVQNLSGEAVTTRFSFKSSGDSVVVDPGGTLEGKAQVLDKKYRWKSDGSQELILLIKEGSSGGRVFRIGF